MTTAAEKTMAVATESIAESTAANKAPEKRRALGRGLDSLLPGGPRVVGGTAVALAPSASPAVAPAAPVVRPGEAVLQIPLEAIDQNPYQTRHFTRDEETGEGGKSLAELAESIQVNGVIQPITVRPGTDGRYLLITGERRCKASTLAGKEKIPAIVRQVSEQQAAEMTVVENLQREDLNCIDQARAFVMLSQHFGLTQEQIGRRVGVSRETVANYMRLVRLPEDVQQFLKNGQLDFSHARVLLNLRDLAQASKVAEQAVKKHLSVEQLEDLIFEINAPLGPQDAQAGRVSWVDPNVRAAQQELERILGVKVKIRDRRGKGKIVIEYASLEDFDRVLEMLKGKP